MTTDETRDELARMDGWRKYADGRWYKQGEWPKRDHPYPPTLDGANAAVPEGWTWLRRDFEWQGFEPNAPGREPVRVPDHGHGHEMADLYALALACRRAMEKQK